MKIDLRRNLGSIDRVIRVFAGLTLISLPVGRVIELPAYGNWLLYLLGLSQIVEGALGY